MNVARNFRVEENKYMKKLLLLTAAILVYGSPAHAGSQPTIDTEYLKGAPVGIICTTGTAVQVNLTPPATLSSAEAERVAGWRIQNQDSTYSVWIGSNNVTISEIDGLGTLGEKLVAGADGSYSLGRQRHLASWPYTVLGCKAESAAGTSGVLLSVFWFVY